jgi:hypothetical protein
MRAVFLAIHFFIVVYGHRLASRGLKVRLQQPHGQLRHRIRQNRLEIPPRSKHALPHIQEGKTWIMFIFGFEGVTTGTDLAGVEEDEGDGPATEGEDSEGLGSVGLLGNEPKDLTPSNLT